jgi:hypothetical protein
VTAARRLFEVLVTHPVNRAFHPTPEFQ